MKYYTKSKHTGWKDYFTNGSLLEQGKTLKKWNDPDSPNTTTTTWTSYRPRGSETICPRRWQFDSRRIYVCLRTGHSLHISGGQSAAGSQRADSLGSCATQPACYSLGWDGRIAVSTAGEHNNRLDWPNNVTKTEMLLWQWTIEQTNYLQCCLQFAAKLFLAVNHEKHVQHNEMSVFHHHQNLHQLHSQNTAVNKQVQHTFK